MKKMKQLALLFMVMVFAACSAPSGQLQCNIGVADITPDEHVVLAGFAARKGLSTDIHRHLKTRCLVVRNDSIKVCVISNDMMEIPISMANELRNEISAQTGIPYSHIFIHCTHTHSAPRVSGTSVEEGGTNFAFAWKVRKVIIDNAVFTANNTAAFIPFTIETGKGQSDINCNRGEKDGPCDHDVYAARLLDKKGKVIASLVNFACHPVSLNHRSLVVSTDFPGITVEELSKDWRGEVFYFAGAAGNVNPCGPLQADTSYTQARGKELADATRQIHFKTLNKSQALQVRDVEVKLPFRVPEITPETINAHVAEIKQWEVSGTWRDDVDGWQTMILDKIGKGEVKNYLPFEIASVNIGGLVLFFSQGEPFNEYQVSLRENFPDVPVFFIAYTNGQNSYLPSKRAYESNAYEYEKEQMHIYIKAPYPLSDNMPTVYEMATKEIVKSVLSTLE